MKALLSEALFSPEESSDDESMDENTFMEPSQKPSRSKAAHSYSLEDLNARVQASPAEILAELQRLEAIEHEGVYLWVALVCKGRERHGDKNVYGRPHRRVRACAPHRHLETVGPQVSGCSL